MRNLTQTPKQAQFQAELEEWRSLPFYLKDKFSELLCVENQPTIKDKMFVFSCILDNLKATPKLLEISTREADKEALAEHSIEMCKLYQLFAQEQFSILMKAIEESKGDLC